MPNFPTFFFSHARQDQEMPGKYLRCFFEDLESRLAQWAGVSLRDAKLGTIDSRVNHGDDWDAELSRGLSENRAFLAIITPLYFNRPNCGKEVAVFLQRSRELGIDPNGALTGAKNVLVIRWLPENAYAANAVKDSLIPPILRRIEDTPTDDGRDEERTHAIERYRKKGMERCIRVEPHYGELLDQFVVRIRDMLDLPAAEGISFATAQDAFRYDWRNHFDTVGACAVVARPETSVRPQALSSVVAFYVTYRQFTATPIAVDFADYMIAEPLPGVSIPIDPGLATLLVDVRAAGIAEGLTVFHVATNPALPAGSDLLIERLASLSSARILTALIIDPEIWPGLGNAETAAAAVERTIGSPRWTGLALIPTMDASAANLDELVVGRGLPPRVVVLPQESKARVAALQRAFVALRGRVLRASNESAPGAERVPLLNGVGRERT